MLPRRNRLDKKDIPSVKKSGLKIYNQTFSICYIRNLNNEARFAIQVPKKVHRKAVDRNRSKRLIRQSLVRYLRNRQPNISAVISLSQKKDIYKYEDFYNYLKQLLDQTETV